jgi:hypothetical protein
MVLHDAHDRANSFYHGIYNVNYWCQEDIPDQLRWDDAWPAVCYAHDIFSCAVLQVDASIHEQISYLEGHRARTPGHVLEIGSGRGEISCTLSHMKYRVTTVEVNDNSERFHRIFSEQHFGSQTDDSHTLLIGDLDMARSRLDLDTVDTIIMVESIEHILSDEWWRFFTHMLPIMQRNHTRLIITNLLGYWPLGLPGDCAEHVSLIDEAFYDRLAQHASTVLHRNRSHLALDY